MTTRLELLPDVYLTAVQTSRFKTACFSLSFLRPLRQEEAGMNALLPSVLLRGSESAPSIRAIADRLDALCGASVGSLVRKKGEIQLTGLFADGLEDRYAGEPVFSRLLELTAELLLRPRTQGGVFVPQIVMQERQKLLDTIESTLDDKAEYCQTQLLRQMCRGEAYAVGRLGEAGSLAAVDEAALWAHYQKVLASSRAELFYLGSKPAQEVAALLRPLLKDLPRGACVPVSTAPGPQPKALRRTRERLPLAQGRIALGFRTGITLHDGRYPAMLLCNAILGGGEQNRLYTVIRGEQSLCYEAGSWYDGHKGILCAEAGCDFADLPAVEAAILQQVGALAAGDFSQQELDTARAGLLSDLRAMHDSPGRLDEFLTGRAAENLPQDPDALAAALRRVTKEDVRQAAVGTLAAELLLGESSALYETLYEASLIDADFSACFTQVPGAALLQAGGTGRRPDAVLAAILRGAEQALAQGFDPRRFARLQKSACGRLIRELDGSESTCYRICEAYFAGAGCFDELAALQAVTLREAESFLRRTVTPARAAISIVCPGK